jgi:hypothetical protein
VSGYSKAQTQQGRCLAKINPSFSSCNMLMRVGNQYVACFPWSLSAQMPNASRIWVWAICPISSAFLFLLENSHLKSKAVNSLAWPSTQHSVCEWIIPWYEPAFTTDFSSSPKRLKPVCDYMYYFFNLATVSFNHLSP